MSEELNGATVVPEWQKPTDTKPECMQRWKHSWGWLWQNGVMTDKLQCATCGEIRDSKDTGQ